LLPLDEQLHPSHSYPTPKFHSSKYSPLFFSSVVAGFWAFCQKWKEVEKNKEGKKMTKSHLCVGCCLHGAIQWLGLAGNPTPSRVPSILIFRYKKGPLGVSANSAPQRQQWKTISLLFPGLFG
jgi:hypothetical protein